MYQFQLKKTHAKNKHRQDRNQHAPTGTTHPTFHATMPPTPPPWDLQTNKQTPPKIMHVYKNYKKRRKKKKWITNKLMQNTEHTQVANRKQAIPTQTPKHSDPDPKTNCHTFKVLELSLIHI